MMKSRKKKFVQDDFFIPQKNLKKKYQKKQKYQNKKK